MSDSFNASKPRRVVRIEDLTVNNTTVGQGISSGVASFSAPLYTARLHAFLSNTHTPLLRTLAGLDTPTGGRLRWRRRLSSLMSAKPIPIAYIPRHPRLTYGISVHDTLMLPLASSGSEIDERFFGRLTSALDLDDVLYVDVAELDPVRQSSVVIARSLIFGSQILLLEEPTDNLSPQDAQTLMATLKALAAQGYCVALQTRSPEVASQADKVFMLVDGSTVGTFEGADASTIKAEYSAVVPSTPSPTEEAPTSLPQDTPEETYPTEQRQENLVPVPLALPVDQAMKESQARAWGLTALRPSDSSLAREVEEYADDPDDLRPKWQPTRFDKSPLLTPIPSAFPEPHEAEGSTPAKESTLGDSEIAVSVSESEQATLPAVATPLTPPAPRQPFPSAKPSSSEPSSGTTTLPRIPRPSRDITVEASADVITTAQEILKDLPGSVLPHNQD